MLANQLHTSISAISPKMIMSNHLGNSGVQTQADDHTQTSRDPGDLRATTKTALVPLVSVVDRRFCKICGAVEAIVTEKLAGLNMNL